MLEKILLDDNHILMYLPILIPILYLVNIILFDPILHYSDFILFYTLGDLSNFLLLFDVLRHTLGYFQIICYVFEVSSWWEAVHRDRGWGSFFDILNTSTFILIFNFYFGPNSFLWFLRNKFLLVFIH